MGKKALFFSIVALVASWVMRATSHSSDLTLAVIASFVVMLTCGAAFVFGVLGLVKQEVDENGYLVEKRNAWIGVATGFCGVVIMFPLFRELVF